MMAETNDGVFDPVEDIIGDIRAGKLVIITDDEDRENEGDLIGAAELMTPEMVNFMITEGRGMLCAPVSEGIAATLRLGPMVAQNRDTFRTNYTVTVDAARGVTTGVSAFDRAHTIRTLADPASTAGDLVQPGHVNPLVARPGGVLRRAGHTEAAVDLAVMAGLRPAGALIEILASDGRAMRVPGEVADGEPVLVRVHSEGLTGDVFGSQRCDCGWQLDAAMGRIAEEGRGVLLYMRQEGRGIGLAAKIHAYKLQEEGLDTVEANERLGFPMDLRDYGMGAQMLHDLGVRKIRLMTNNPRKIVGLEGHSLEIVEQIPVKPVPNQHNRRYLETKRLKMGHVL